MTRHVFFNKKLLEAEVVEIMEEPKPGALLLAFMENVRNKLGIKIG
jgi:hypothetical protein